MKNIKIRPVTILLLVVAALFAVIGFVYVADTAALAGLLPGHAVHSANHHYSTDSPRLQSPSPRSAARRLTTAPDTKAITSEPAPLRRSGSGRTVQIDVETLQSETSITTPSTATTSGGSSTTFHSVIQIDLRTQDQGERFADRTRIASGTELIDKRGVRCLASASEVQALVAQGIEHRFPRPCRRFESCRGRNRESAQAPRRAAPRQQLSVAVPSVSGAVRGSDSRIETDLADYYEVGDVLEQLVSCFGRARCNDSPRGQTTTAQVTLGGGRRVVADVRTRESRRRSRRYGRNLTGRRRYAPRTIRNALDFPAMRSEDARANHRIAATPEGRPRSTEQVRDPLKCADSLRRATRKCSAHISGAERH